MTNSRGVSQKVLVVDDYEDLRSIVMNFPLEKVAQKDIVLPKS